MKEAPTTPYLIRAIYEWCTDNGYTPYIAVKFDKTTRVPQEYVRNGEIVLNVSADATRKLKIGNDTIQFSARINGVSREVSVPVVNVAGIFAKENGQGLAFQAPAPGNSPAAVSAPAAQSRDGGGPPPPTGGKRRLKVVK